MTFGKRQLRWNGKRANFRSGLRFEALEERRLLALVPELVRDINFSRPDYLPTFATAVGETLYFVADDYNSGLELWKSDGTAAGTKLVKDIEPGQNYPGPYDLMNVNGTLFFSADDGVHGRELWKSDGTAAGTVMVKDIYPGERGSLTGYGLPYYGNVNGILYFRASDGVTGYELWRSDGTADGTKLVKDIVPGIDSSSPMWPTDVSGTLYFSTRLALWKSDGTEAGTALVYSGFDIPSSLHDFNGTLVFSARTQAFSTELWKSNGHAVNTVMVKDIWPGSRDGWPFGFTSIGEILFFSASDGAHGRELWTSDGTDAGTTQVRDIRPGDMSSGPGNLTNVNGKLYFSADNGSSGQELWTSDGTRTGTAIVKDINPGSRRSYPRFLTGIGDTVYFSAYHVDTGFELWRSDGTREGTVLVQDIRPGSDYYRDPKSSYPVSLTNVSGSLFFFATDDKHGRALYKLVEKPDRQPGDTDSDGDVDGVDLNNVRNHFGQTRSLLGDANGDRKVDLEDLNAVRNNFGAGVPSPAPQRTGPRSTLVAAGGGKVGNSSKPVVDRRLDLLFTAASDATMSVSSLRTPTVSRRLKAVDRVIALL